MSLVCETIAPSVESPGKTEQSILSRPHIAYIATPMPWRNYSEHGIYRTAYIRVSGGQKRLFHTRKTISQWRAKLQIYYCSATVILWNGNIGFAFAVRKLVVVFAVGVGADCEAKIMLSMIYRQPASLRLNLDHVGSASLIDH